MAPRAPNSRPGTHPATPSVNLTPGDSRERITRCLSLCIGLGAHSVLQDQPHGSLCYHLLLFKAESQPIVCLYASCAAVRGWTLEPLPPLGREHGVQMSVQAPALDSLGSYFFVCLALTKATNVNTRSTFVARCMNKQKSCKSWPFFTS